MNIITEYLKLLPKIRENSQKIIQGIITNVKITLHTLKEEEQDEVVRRRVICAGCPFQSNNAKTDPSQNYKTERFDVHCTMCQCNIELKTACLDCNCGIEAWNNEYPNNKMPLKWEKYGQEK